MPKGPQAIGTVLADLMARTGFARVQSAASLEAAWREAAGPSAGRFTRVGALRRGTLEIVVANSTFVQELTFQKAALLGALRRALPDEPIRDLRFRVGPIV
jgi:predicted nucleic acid-binding Zn ribbon protein